MTSVLSPADRERLDELFDRAAELPRAQHAAFVERECGSNRVLRAALARLLAGHAGEDILGGIQPEAPTRAGTTIGPYKLLERIGEGGMGEVYAAQQLAPVVRRVALKIIKPGMDSRQVVARFEAERQALALMSHPNIARILDGGATDDGRPYFVMEYVAGEPITEYCDRRKLETRERVELFLHVCAGVQHAHQKGVIHRDLKPSNVLVAHEDGRAVPKIIDFGVARAVTGRLVERTLHTLLGQIVGTLDYMSPEQADPTAVDIDTRSDIYSLGVVLYQLLSGLLPFEHLLDGKRPLSEVQRILRDTDPPTPSTRLRRKTGTAVAVAPLHGTDERGLLRQLSGDLDWICLKALEKDPARRYASASELAADLERHLADQPVLAGRPGALYRAHKFVRRNKVGVTAGVLIAAAMTAGVFGMVSGRLDALASEQVAAALRPAGDKRRLEELLSRADGELWPPHPAKIPALEAWLAEARASYSDLAGHQASLTALRERALPWTEAERQRDRATHERMSDLYGLETLLQVQTRRVESENAPIRPIAEIEQEIADLEAEIGARRTWSFATPEDQSLHDVLADLVDGLAELGDEETGLLSPAGLSLEHGWSVQRRIDYARELESDFGPGGRHAVAWERELPAIRAAYPGLELSVQTGLVPIGQDPASGNWEFAHLASGEPAERGADGELVVRAETGVVLVLVRGRTFEKGAQSRQADQPNYHRLANDFKESPVTTVTVAPFFIAKYELTQGQWERFVGMNTTGGAPDPLKAANAMNWTLAERTMFRLGLRLPSEEEWEYVARAEDPDVAGSDDWPWGTGPDERSLEGRANLLDLSVPAPMRERMTAAGMGAPPLGWDDGFHGIAPAGTFGPNRLGLYEVYGNVSEWVATRGPINYRTGRRVGGMNEAMARGGSWTSGSESARSAFRELTNNPEFGIGSVGLRPARSIDP